MTRRHALGEIIWENPWTADQIAGHAMHKPRQRLIIRIDPADGVALLIMKTSECAPFMYHQMIRRRTLPGRI